jgi:uncharacterized protein YuzE
MTFHYDDDADVLYVAFLEPKSRARYVETARGDILRYDQETGEIMGITLPFFMERIEKGEKIEIPEIGTPSLSSVFQSVIATQRDKPIQ